MKLNRHIAGLLAAIAIVTSIGVHAQNSTISPYSRFGYGMISDQANTMQKAMGGVGIAMRSGRQINYMNPASYAGMDSLTFLFDMGLDAKVLFTTEGKESGKNFTGGLNYITMQVPLTKWLGASLGLMPYSEVGYSFGDEIVNGTDSRTGDGSLSQLYIGFGATPFKGFSAGVNVSYLFGTLINDTYVYSESSTSLFERVIEVRDYNLRFGLQYGRAINADNYVSVGAVYSPKKAFRGHTYGVKYDVNADAAPDTIANISLNSNAQMAETWGVGISYQWGGRLTAEVDFTYQPWKNVKFATIEGFDNYDRFNDRWKVAVGFQWVTRQRGTWTQRINWRLGGFYCNDYIKVGDNSVREFGTTVGVGLPAPSTKTMVNLSLEYHHRQASPQPLVKENYLLLTVGVNFNELWFWRNKLR